MDSEADQIKQKLIEYLSNPRVIIYDFSIHSNESDGVKTKFDLTTVDLDAQKERADFNFIRAVKDAVLR